MVLVGVEGGGGGIIIINSFFFFNNNKNKTQLCNHRQVSTTTTMISSNNNNKLSISVHSSSSSSNNNNNNKRIIIRRRSPKRLKYNYPTLSYSKDDDRLLYVEVDPFGSDCWKLDPVVHLLKQGAVGVIPTDTVYAIVCDMKNNSAVERLRRIKSIETSKPLSVLCRSFRDIDTLTTGFPRGDGQGSANIFRAVKHCLPGPYTFILTASKELPKQCTRYGATSSKFAHRKSVGVRIPDDDICLAILEKMGAPLISTSVKCPKENQWILDPVVIADLYGPEGLDFVVAAGVRVADPSTVVDMIGGYPKIIRQGKEAVAVTTAIQEEILLEFGIDPRVGLACLGKVNTVFENDQELMIQFYRFVMKEELACEEAELGPDLFAKKMEMHHNLQQSQLEMLEHMRKFHLDDQSAILEKLHQQLEEASFDSEASVLTVEQVQDIVRRRVTPVYTPK